MSTSSPEIFIPFRNFIPFFSSFLFILIFCSIIFEKKNLHPVTFPELSKKNGQKKER